MAGGVRRFALNMTRWRFPIRSGNIRNVHLSDFHVRKIITEYLDDPMFPESGLVRCGDMLGYETDDENQRMPYITNVCSVSYPVEPLFAVGLSVNDLVMEKIRRSPEDTAPSKTFILDNARQNVLELDMPSEERMQAVLANSRGLTGSVRTFRDVAGAWRYRLTGATTEDAVVSIEQGSVDYMRLNPT